MAFDFSQVLQDANKSLASSGEGGTGYKYKLVYPNQGTLTVKLLFNSKSNIVMRAVNRHTIGEDKIACMKTYGQECPICKVLEDIKNARGVDLSKMRSIVRGISIAQYVGSDYKIDGVNPGDIILLMYPWTVYKDISTIISQAKSPEELESLMASNNGFTFNIMRGADNKYTTQINPFNKYQSCATDADFVNLLNSIDALNDQVLKTPATEEILKDVREVAQELQNQYLVNKGPQFANNGMQDAMSMANFGMMGGAPNQAPQVNSNPMQPNLPWGNTAPNQAPQSQFQQPAPSTPQMNTQQYGMPNTPVQAPAQTGATPAGGNPPCFGQHGTQDMNKCLLCPVEIQCGQCNK